MTSSGATPSRIVGSWPSRAKPTRTLKIGKEAFYRQLDMTLEDAYRYTVSVMVENMLDREAEEGIGAFLDKREPNWPR